MRPQRIGLSNASPLKTRVISEAVVVKTWKLIYGTIYLNMLYKKRFLSKYLILFPENTFFEQYIWVNRTPC